MIRKSLGDIHWLEFELLSPFLQLKHAIFLRHGGVSQGSFSGLNLSRTMGDDVAHVASNISLAQSALEISTLAECYQVHSNGIKVVTSFNYALFDEYDALITQEPNLGLKVAHADCQAAIFYDPIQHVVATVHCGWRGHVCNIYAKVIQAMKDTYGSKPTDLHVAIGPSLGPTHAEFVNYRTEFPEYFSQFKLERDYFDLWELAQWQLIQEGILLSHLQIAKICTFEDHVDCFSFRRNKKVTGAHGTVAMLLA